MITAYDIAIRLYRTRRFWIKGPPVPRLEGSARSFGKLIFDFPKEKPQTYRIFIYDPEQILVAAQEAIDNFPELVRPYQEIG